MSKYIDAEAFLEHTKGTNRYFDVKFDIENFPGFNDMYCPHCGARMDGGTENASTEM